MSKHAEHGFKIEAGQILMPDSFPLSNELVCIQIPKIFDQVALRDCVTRIITLMPGPNVVHPIFVFEGVTDFDIIVVKLISKSDSLIKLGFKNLKLFVKMRYKVLYSDGFNELSTIDEVGFSITVNDIYCPDCFAQIGVIKYPDEQPAGLLDEDEPFITVEARADAFNDAICITNGALALDIGAFFIIKCECIVQLLIPSYGYCPIPAEQPNSASQNCSTFNDRIKTPFPIQFYPDQKLNVLDAKIQSKSSKEEL